MVWTGGVDGSNAVAAANGDSDGLGLGHGDSGARAAADGTCRGAGWVDSHGVCDG